MKEIFNDQVKIEFVCSECENTAIIDVQDLIASGVPMCTDCDKEMDHKNTFIDEDDEGTFIVLETHGGPEYSIVCMNENGEPEVFSSRKEAEEYAKNVQAPVIVKL